ncbi:MAG: V-type ATPase subunit [Clostridiales bacterium]|nr:V-type ATPase subunit [Clostridiales bacterium]
MKIKDTDYAFGVAKIRANELNLLTQVDFDSLIAANDYKSALRILEDKGWAVPEKSTSFASMLEKFEDDTWQLVCACLPVVSTFDSLILPNDFYNLKAAIKAVFSDLEPNDYFIRPFVTDPALIAEAVTNKKFDILPKHLKDTAVEAYDAVVRVGSGRLADIIIDKASLNTALASAKNSGNQALTDLAELSCACANIKIAFRSAETGRDTEFMLRCMADCDTVDNKRLAFAAADGGREAIAEYLQFTPYSEAGEKLAESAVAFEKWCDDSVMGSIGSKRLAAFGPEPIIGYYLTCLAAVKNVRIILSAKLNGVSSEEIRKRVRNINV